jgi:hypothetical protein
MFIRLVGCMSGGGCGREDLTIWKFEDLFA